MEDNWGRKNISETPVCCVLQDFSILSPETRFANGRFPFDAQPDLGRNMPVIKKTSTLVVVWFVANALWAGPSQWVNPFVGTAHGGNTFPGALVPWGMVSVSPHNDLKAPSGYIHGNPTIYGFGHVHLSGTGCPDLGSVLIMPTVGDIRIEPEKIKSDYESEEASPGYYRVNLKTYEILAEMTATTHAGMSQYTFPE